MKYLPYMSLILFSYILLMILISDLYYDEKGPVFMFFIFFIVALSLFEKSIRKNSLIVLILMITLFIPFFQKHTELSKENYKKYNMIVKSGKVDSSAESGTRYVKTGFVRSSYRFWRKGECINFYFALYDEFMTQCYNTIDIH